MSEDLVAESYQGGKGGRVCWVKSLLPEARSYISDLEEAIKDRGAPVNAKVSEILRRKFDVIVGPSAVGAHLSRRECGCWK